MKDYLVVDGYNLLHAAAEQTGDTRPFEEQRERLIARVANYAALTGQETCLVFDAWGSAERLSAERVSGITVVYTGKDQTADTYIEKYLYARPRLAHVVLVTGDSAVQNMALLTGAERVSSRQFLALLAHAETQHTEALGGADSGALAHSVGEHVGAAERAVLEAMRRGK